MVPTNIGAHLKSAHGLPAFAATAATRNGAAIDRQGYHSAVLQANIGAATGAPTSYSVDVKLQDSDDGSTNWNDYKADGTNVSAIPQKTQVAGAGTYELDVNLIRAKRFIRVVEVVAIVGGTSPTVPCAEIVALGGPAEQPV